MLKFLKNLLLSDSSLFPVPRGVQRLYQYKSSIPSVFHSWWVDWLQPMEDRLQKLSEMGGQKGPGSGHPGDQKWREATTRPVTITLRKYGVDKTTVTARTMECTTSWLARGEKQKYLPRDQVERDEGRESSRSRCWKELLFDYVDKEGVVIKFS